MKRAKLGEMDSVPLVPNVCVVETRQMTPNDWNTSVYRTVQLVAGRAAAVAAARAEYDKLCKSLPTLAEEDEEELRVAQIKGGVLRVQVRAANGETVATLRRECWSHAEEEIRAQTEEAEERKRQHREANGWEPKGVRVANRQDTLSIHCFLWCHKLLEGRKLPKDILKLIAKTVRASPATLMVGLWRGVPHSMYVLHIAVLVPTYDLMIVEETSIVVAESDASACQIAKRAFVKCINGRWRDGFECEIRDSEDDVKERNGLEKPANIPHDFNEHTIDQFTTDMLRWLWDCCDDNMGTQFAHGPAVMSLTRDGKTVLQLPGRP